MRVVRPPLFATLVVLAFCGASLLLAARPAHFPPRESFALFPMRLADWRGRSEKLDPGIVEALKLEDYLLANFHSPAQTPRINVYVAYYSSQQLGAAAHSPRSCIPGGGWEIEKLSQATVTGTGTPFAVNRVIIAKGPVRQLVYYWFDQRGRLLTNEYAVKWYLLVDGLMNGRTDGALIRLVTPISVDGVDAADQRLREFIRLSYARLRSFIPS